MNVNNIDDGRYMQGRINTITSDAKNHSMSEEEFYKKYCKYCGSQRCTGVNDYIFREGCPFYQKEYKQKE